MTNPFFTLTEIYNDATGEKYDRPLHILPPLLTRIVPFEITYDSDTFSVKEDDKEIIKLYLSKCDELGVKDILGDG